MSGIRIRTEVEYTAAHYEGLVVRLSGQLHDLADRIVREGRAVGRVGREGRYASGAGSVVHALSWGVANLNLSSLIDAAFEADRAEACVLDALLPTELAAQGGDDAR